MACKWKQLKIPIPKYMKNMTTMEWWCHMNMRIPMDKYKITIRKRKTK